MNQEKESSHDTPRDQGKYKRGSMPIFHHKKEADKLGAGAGATEVCRNLREKAGDFLQHYGRREGTRHFPI